MLLDKIPISFIPPRASLQAILEEIKRAISTASYSYKRKLRSYEINHPWLAGHIQYRLARTNLQDAIRRNDLDAIKLHRKQVHTLFHKAKAEYCSKKLNSDGTPLDLHNFVKFTKNLRSLPIRMNYKNQLSTNIAEDMADHLSRAFGGADESLYDEAAPMNEKLRNIWEEAYVNNPDFEDIGSFTPSDVYDVISAIDVNKDPGMALMHTAPAEKMTEILTPFFNACALIQWFPIELLQTVLIPIPKTGDKEKIENYRGIAISSIITKLIDKLITRKLENNIESLLTDSQYGFRRNRSTVDCINDAIQFISEHMKWDGRVDAVFIDFAKAFDRLTHTSIAKALASAGMPLRQLQLIMFILSNRQYFVKINNVISQTSIVPDSGIPQGSHIGPTLFILVANALRNCLRQTTKLFQYADDVLLIQPISTGADEDELQRSIDALFIWGKSVGLEINRTKSRIKKIHQRKKRYDHHLHD